MIKWQNKNQKPNIYLSYTAKRTDNKFWTELYGKMKKNQQTTTNSYAVQSHKIKEKHYYGLLK